MYNVRHVRPSVYDLWTYGLSNYSPAALHTRTFL